MRLIKFPVVNVHDNNSNNGKGKRHRKRYYERRPTKYGGGIEGKGEGYMAHHCEFSTITTSLYEARNMISMMTVAMMIATMVVEWQAKCLTSNLVSEPKNNVKSHNTQCSATKIMHFWVLLQKALTGKLTVEYNNGDGKNDWR